jgi:septum site-determining protein MinC
MSTEETVSLIQIKGIRDGLLVTLAASEWDVAQNALIEQIDARSAFFNGARLALDVGSHAIGVNELVALRDRLSERNVVLWAVVSESPKTENTAQLLGLATRISKPRPEEIHSHSIEEVSDASAMFVNKTLRSGTRVEFPGTIVILGDINPGAEVVADGNVIVWGHVRGMIHAGAKGDRSAVICALDLSATQIRIADAVSANLKPQKNPRPEIASLNHEGALQSEIWKFE